MGKPSTSPIPLFYNISKATNLDYASVWAFYYGASKVSRWDLQPFEGSTLYVVSVHLNVNPQLRT
jgi:hypothetical protein